MKKAFSFLIYASFVFLLIYLYRLDYLSFSGLEWRVAPLMASVLFLWAGFLLSSLSWWFILKKHSMSVKPVTCIISHGLYVFAKYIPGKIWVILGRAGYITQVGYSLKSTSFFSFKEQIIYLWCGLLISAIPMLFFFGFTPYTAGALAALLFMTFFLFSKRFHHFFLGIAQRLSKRKWEIPFVGFRESGGIMVFVLGYWALWLIAFYFLIIAFYPSAGPEVSFAFPLSVTVGLMAIFFPGGLGVREGIMAGYLVLAGIPPETAATITLFARVWFITGEVFIFLTALVLRSLRGRPQSG